jgi:crotonobetainyl-CoA:carnitine CoA-transferase CaiB-like acyl-CoA transferase
MRSTQVKTFFLSRAFIKSSEFYPGIRRCAPNPGEHNNEIYEQEMGMSKEELVMLRKNKVI